MNLSVHSLIGCSLTAALFVVGCDAPTPPAPGGESGSTVVPPALLGDEEGSGAKIEGMETPGAETPTPEAGEAKPDAEKPEMNVSPETSQTQPKAEEAVATTDTKPEEQKPAEEESEAAEPKEMKLTGDWPMWGGDIYRNMVNASQGIDVDFEAARTVEEGKNLLWTAQLGSQTYGNPVVASGIVLVGTNNGAEYRPKHKGDRGVVLCFDEKSGELLWQLTREKLDAGRVNDWPEQGICSTPCVEGDKIYVVTNRCEVMCLDKEGFHDGENDGKITDEPDAEELDADIIWSLDMIEELGVFPHNLATSSPVIVGDTIFVLTSNGVDEAHLEIPSPRAPCFLAINKNTGEVIWEDNTPFDQILHGQWSSPCIGDVNGKQHVYMPGGDGWLYAFELAPVADMEAKLVWKFDLNPKDSKWELGGRGTRNALISTPVFYDNSVILSVGQDPEHGEGVGHIYRIDATKEGDISPTLADGSENPNSGQIWHLGGVDEDGSITGSKGELVFRRTISTVSIHNGLVYAPDLSGFLHCIDFETGKQYWEYDAFAAIWGSPMVVDGYVMLGDEDGDLVILKEGKQEEVVKEKIFDSSIYSTPTIANGRMFVSDRSRLYCFDLFPEKSQLSMNK